MRLPFVGGSNPSRSYRVSRERLLNGLVELDPSGKFDRMCFCRPGLTIFAGLGAAGTRGGIEWGGNAYAVVGGDVKKITSAGVITTIGSIGTTTGVVVFSPGPSHLVFVDGSKGYYTQGSSVTEIASNFPDGATHIAYHSGFWLANDTTNAGRFYRSDSLDPTTWGSLNFATAERSPDALKGIIVASQQIWLAGDTTTEAWGPDDSSFGFGNIAGGFTEVGLAAPYSLAKGAAGTVYWLAKAEQGQGAVMRGQGIQGQRISTPAIEAEFAGYTLSDAIGFCIYWQGHSLYMLRFPTDAKTWVWDESSQVWCEWTRYGGGAFRANCAISVFDKILVGDPEDGNLFELDADAHADNGEVIEFWRYDRHMVEAGDRKPLSHRGLELEVETGVGTDTMSPQWMLQWSDDGGHTWSNEHWRSSGLIGERNTRLVWRRLGRSRDRVYRVGSTDKAKRVIVSGWVDVEAGL